MYRVSIEFILALGAVGDANEDDLICGCRELLIWDLNSWEYTIKFRYFAGHWLNTMCFLGSCVTVKGICIVTVADIPSGVG